MSVYVVAQLRFTERAAYQRYQAQFWDVFKQFNGKLLASDEHPVVREGHWDRDKIVILEFPDAESAHAFEMSPAYQRIAVDRRAGADAVILHVAGL
jgi:uncharacterized protein (DUF1330 family)